MVLQTLASQMNSRVLLQPRLFAALRASINGDNPAFWSCIRGRNLGSAFIKSLHTSWNISTCSLRLKHAATSERKVGTTGAMRSKRQNGVSGYFNVLAAPETKPNGRGFTKKSAKDWLEMLAFETSETLPPDFPTQAQIGACVADVKATSKTTSSFGALEASVLGRLGQVDEEIPVCIQFPSCSRASLQKFTHAARFLRPGPCNARPHRSRCAPPPDGRPRRRGVAGQDHESGPGSARGAGGHYVAEDLAQVADLQVEGLLVLHRGVDLRAERHLRVLLVTKALLQTLPVLLDVPELLLHLVDLVIRAVILLVLLQHLGLEHGQLLPRGAQVVVVGDVLYGAAVTI
eukprot:scaffold3307_cov265-Pinguiococcus_pyrenoidosus.AAC.4